MKTNRNSSMEKLPPLDTNVSQIPVAVIIPCYSCAETIDRAVESVLNQTLLPSELWLIEDGSSDNGRTLSALNRLKSQYSGTIDIEIIKQGKNTGSAIARNTGWDITTQPYIAFLDADDSWHPRKLEIQYQWMKRHPDVVITGHQWPVITTCSARPKLSQVWLAHRISKRMQLVRSRFSTITVMMLSSLPYRFTNPSRSEDFRMWLRIILDGYTAWRLELPLAYVHKAPYGEGGLTKNLWYMERAELATYWTLVKERRLNIIVFAVIAPWSLTKFLRRLLLIKVGHKVRSS